MRPRHSDAKSIWGCPSAPRLGSPAPPDPPTTPAAWAQGCVPLPGHKKIQQGLTELFTPEIQGCPVPVLRGGEDHSSDVPHPRTGCAHLHMPWSMPGGEWMPRNSSPCLCFPSLPVTAHLAAMSGTVLLLPACRNPLKILLFQAGTAQGWHRCADKLSLPALSACFPD